MRLQKQIFFSLIFGLLSGVFFGELCAPLEVAGRAYIMLLKMTILPYMSFALIHAIGSLSFESAKTLFSKGIKFLILLWGVTFGTISALAITFPTFDRPSHFSSSDTPERETESFLDLFIPVNPFHAIANDIIPAVVVFSLLFGLAIISKKSKGTLLNTLQVILAGLTSITHWVNNLSPIGVFCLIASRIGTISFEQIGEIRIYLFCYYTGALLLGLLIFPMIVSSFCNISKREFLKAVQPAALLAFTTGNNLVSLPLIISGVEQLSKENYLNETKSNKIIDTVVPITYNFPTAGNLLTLLFIYFLASFYAHTISWIDNFKLLFTSLFALFGAASSVINGAAFLIDQAKLPIDGFTLFIQTMPITRNFQTMLSSIQITALTTLVCFAYNNRTTLLWKRFIGNSALSLLLLGTLLFFGNYLNISESKRKTQLFSQLKIQNPVEHEIGDRRAIFDKETDPLDRIESSKVLRIGFFDKAMPFSYKNRRGELVGYDIALAHELARSLGAKIIFIPFTYDSLIDDFEEQKFDIAMSAISVNDERISKLRLCSPYLSTERALVVKDYRREEFSSSTSWINDPTIKIAVKKGTSFEKVAYKLFREEKIVVIEENEQFLQEGVADALLWTKEEGTNWSLVHPDFTTIPTNLSLGHEHFTYALSQNSPKLQDYLNYWLDIKKLDQFTLHLKEYWILGKPSESKPRWSVIRDVLHWID